MARPKSAAQHLPRRALLKAGAGALAWSGLSWAATPATRFVSGIRDPKIAGRRPGEGFAAAAFTAAGTLLWQTPLPARSHGQAWHPRGDRLVVFARRPGDYAALIAPATGKVITLIAPPEGRVFQGHGCFSLDGKRLYTAENAFEQGRGVIGIYDAATLARLGEWRSGGIGVHEILMTPKGLLAIANGGILTHPGMPRKKLNLSTMHSELTLMDPRTGTIIARHALAAGNQALSLRHLALSPNGRMLAVAAQHQHQRADVPLLYTLELSQPGSALIPRPLPAPLLAQMKGYCGSVAFSPCGQWLYGSSPRGGVMVAVSLTVPGAKAKAMPLPDGCGIATSADLTVFTSGSGAIVATASQRPFPLTEADATTKKEDLPLARHSLPVQFDNHALALI